MKKILGAWIAMLVLPLGLLGAEPLQSVDSFHSEAAKAFLHLQVNPEIMEESYQQTATHIATKFQLDIQPKINRAFTEDEVRRLQFFWYNRLKDMMPYSKLEELIVPVITKNFTVDELHDINRFLQSPTGLKLTEIQPIIAEEARIAGEEMGKKIADKQWIEATKQDLMIQFPQWKSVLD